MKEVLIVDDDMGSRESLKAILSGAYQVCTAASAREAAQVLGGKSVDVMLLDVIMPETDGIAFLQEARTTHPNLPVIMVSASTSVKPVVAAMRGGAFDYVTKPFEIDEIRLLVERAIESNSLQRHMQNFQGQIAQEFPVDAIVGGSPEFHAALADARQAAESEANVLIRGESGTGKELIARLIHHGSARAREPFVPVHCAALPESLMESELFGHEKGPVHRIERHKLGRFDLAGAGTLFLDEVSEMSMATQVKLLRVIQEREFMRVGGTLVIHTNARIVAATSMDLDRAVKENRFRQDLFYRLNVVPIHLPNLRDRQEDIPILARHFLTQIRSKLQARANDLDAPAMDLLCRYRWPGNVRELRNVVERMMVLHGREPIIRAEMLPEEFHRLHPEAAGNGANGNLNLAEAVNAFERKLVENALREANGVQTRAAELLGTTRRILKYRMEKLNIPG
jgi:DNA-binding NtrC family response regulator